ncbi:MAG: hypothetical protein FWG85_02360 [Bacteroidetes bacterium]|nr:hypothetical protein [Bacteroidota bacterium]
MKITFYTFIYIFSVALLFSQNPPFNGNGDGSQYNPFQIWDKKDLQEFADSVYADVFQISWCKNKYFRLMDNIYDVNISISGYFYGHFEGNGKKISFPLVPDPTFFGLFGWLSLDASIDNLVVDGCSLYSGIVSHIAGGGPLSKPGTITNCINNAIISISDDYAIGSIASTNQGTISNCINNGDITGVENVGGITGQNSGTITNCINTGKITATNSGSQPNGAGGVGGIVAYGSVSNCINLGSVVGKNNVGGISGLSSESATITNCINYGFIKGIDKVGGICGTINYLNFPSATISNSVNVGVVEGEEDIGSIVGKE